jgi:hypothetical protein
MVILLVLIILLGLILFLLLTPIWIELDTRVPFGRLQCWGVGGVELYHDKQWIVRLRILFFKKIFYLEKITKANGAKRKKKKREPGIPKRRGMSLWVMLKKMKRVYRSFTVEKWQLAIDTGDATLNARLYPLNWIPVLQGHLFVNFNGDQHFQCRIRNAGWRLLWAWFRK